MRKSFRMTLVLFISLTTAIGCVRTEPGGVSPQANSSPSPLEAKQLAHNVQILNAIYSPNTRNDAASQAAAALKTDANNVDALNILGNYYLIKKQPNEAVKFLEKSLSLDPANNYTKNDLGRALLKSGKKEEAKKLLGEVVATRSQASISAKELLGSN